MIGPLYKAMVVASRYIEARTRIWELELMGYARIWKLEQVGDGSSMAYGKSS